MIYFHLNKERHSANEVRCFSFPPWVSIMTAGLTDVCAPLRLQRVRQRATENTRENNSTMVGEVNPEFLAALPPNIQEEVLTQQRLEQQRQQAARANPDDPMDPVSFLQTLPSSLRQTVSVGAVLGAFLLLLRWL